jgi:ACS family D-galactonate transporter-like MFS transporter
VSFAIAGIGTVLCGFFAWWYIRNEPGEHPAVNNAEARFIADAHEREDAAAPASAGGKLREFFRYRSVWCMALGWMFFNVVFYGLLTWMPSYLYDVHGLDIKHLGGSLFIMFFAGFVGELIGGQIADFWRARGGSPNTIFRTLFSIAAIVATVSVVLVAYVENSALIVALLSATLFFLRWCGMYWAIPSILGSRARSGFLGGFMNLGGNIAGIATPIIVGAIVQTTGSYFLALIFFALAGIALLACSLAIDYDRRIPI